MTSPYIYTPAIWAPLAGAVLLAGLSLYSWRHRGVPGAAALAAGSLCAALWLVGMTMEITAVAPDTKITWHKAQAALMLFAVIVTTCFALEYAHPGRWLTHRSLFLLFLPAFIGILLIVVNDGQTIWRRLEIAPDGSVVAHLAIPGAIIAAYALSLILVNGSAFGWLFARSPQHRWPVLLMLFGEIAARGLFLLNVAQLPALRGFDPFATGILLLWIAYAIALFGFHIFDPLAVARQSAIAQMPEGMAVLDTDGRVASLNPAAADIVNTTEARARGKTLEELLPEFPGLVARLAIPGDAPIEVGLDRANEDRSYALSLPPLEDFRGLLIGNLLMIRDVTEQRRAQAIILDERWAQAALQERELLADELHDGLSQNLAFLNLQAQAAQVYLHGGRKEDAEATLARLAQVTRQIQNDMRELIGDLLIVSCPSEGFCETLRQAVSRFEAQSGVTVTLEFEDNADAFNDPALLTPAAGVQLVRIAQEALANVRKHAGHPDEVSVRVAMAPEQMRLTVEDDGVGFDPDALCDDGRHFGLRVMHKRATRIGGRMEVRSAPGRGVRVEVCVPLGPQPEQIEEMGEIA